MTEPTVGMTITILTGKLSGKTGEIRQIEDEGRSVEVNCKPGGGWVKINQLGITLDPSQIYYQQMPGIAWIPRPIEQIKQAIALHGQVEMDHKPVAGAVVAASHGHEEVPVVSYWDVNGRVIATHSIREHQGESYVSFSKTWEFDKHGRLVRRTHTQHTPEGVDTLYGDDRYEYPAGKWYYQYTHTFYELKKKEYTRLDYRARQWAGFSYRVAPSLDGRR